MQTRLNPYLSFKSNARQAMEFYKSVFGGELRLTTFKEYHASQTPDEDNLIMHAELNAGDGLLFMASDTPARMEYHPGTNMNMSLTGENEAELKPTSRSSRLAEWYPCRLRKQSGGIRLVCARINSASVGW